MWHRALAETGLSAAFYAERGRERDEILPWDHLSAGVSREYLWERIRKGEGRRIYRRIAARGGCTLCGVCDHKTVIPLIHEEPSAELKQVEAPELPAPACDGQGIPLQGHLLKAWESAVFRAVGDGGRTGKGYQARRFSGCIHQGPSSPSEDLVW